MGDVGSDGSGSLGEAVPERPQHPRDERVQVLASVAVHGGAEMVILGVQNLSVSGVLLAADAEDHELLPIGRIVQVTVFDTAHATHKVEIEARVVRHEPGGIALGWDRTLRAASLLRLIVHCRR
jgi:hypothetical protein